MKGIDFVVDESGRKKAVLIDLTEWGELWEDFYDVLVSHVRREEPPIQWVTLKTEYGRPPEAWLTTRSSSLPRLLGSSGRCLLM